MSGEIGPDERRRPARSPGGAPRDDDPSRHDDEPLRHPRWMKVVALICLVAAVALVIVGMIP